MEDLRRVNARLNETDDPLALLVGLVAHVPVAFQVFRLDGTCVLVNRAFRELFGAEPHPDLNVLGGKPGEGGFQALFRRACGGETVSVPDRWHEPDDLRRLGITSGRRLALEATLFPMLQLNGAPRYVAACFKDVSAARELGEVALTALRASEARFRTLVDSFDDLIYTVDRKLRCTGAFGRWLERNRRSSEQYVGKPLAELVAGGYEDVHWQALAGAKVTYEWTTDGADGPRHFHSCVSPLHAGDGDVIGLVGVARDITELKKVQAQLLVSDRMASVGMLAAGVAHELNNPLASVMANLDLVTREIAALALREGLVTDLGETLEELRDAGEAAARMREIVRDLKVFSRSSTDEERRPIDVNAALEAVSRVALNEIRHRARLVMDLRKVPRVLANEARLGQVFLNLVVNATHAVPEGNAQHHEIRLATSVDARGRVVIEVSDTGSGMSRELQARLFTPFFTTKPVGAGSGLGLSICHRVVSALGGEIQVSSRVGKGSTFRVFLPAEGPEVVLPAIEAAPAPPAAADPHRGAVLVVDDEPMISAVVRRTLAAAHDVTVCNSAEDALAKIVAGARYDVILCDLMMPTMTGMELHDELLRVAPEQVSRMIFVTGGAFTQRAREFLDSTACERLEKPFNPQGLRALVGARVKRRP